MVTYKELNKTNTNYKPEFNDRLYLLYKGGYDARGAARMLLPKLASETEVGYEDRLTSADYLPLMSDVIDYFSSLLFSGDLSVIESTDADNAETLGSQMQDESVYRLFLNRADLKDHNLEQVLHHTFNDALIYGEAFIGIDFPRTEERPINLLEEEVIQSGRPYLFDIDPNCITDWRCDENTGKFIWAKLKSDVEIQEDPLDPPMHKICFKLWRMKNGLAAWETYESALLKMNKPNPDPNDLMNLVDSGTTTFKEIPILKLHLPDGLKLGRKIGPLCENIFQRTSLLYNGENKSLNAMRIAFLGDESNAPNQGQSSMVQENPFRHMSLVAEYEAKGLGVLGANDDVKIIEPNGNAFKIVDEQIDKQISRVKETVHQMANSAAQTSTKLGKSAQSQQESRHATEILLTTYGNIVRDFIRAIMACISAAREEDIVWQVQGLDNYSIIDRDQLINESANLMMIVGTAKSTTFKKLYLEKLYLNLIDGIAYDEARMIRKEIEDSVDAEAKNPELDKMMPMPTNENNKDKPANKDADKNKK